MAMTDNQLGDRASEDQWIDPADHHPGYSEYTGQWEGPDNLRHYPSDDEPEPEDHTSSA